MNADRLATPAMHAAIAAHAQKLSLRSMTIVAGNKGPGVIGPSAGTKKKLQQWSHNPNGATSTPGGTGLGPAHPSKKYQPAARRRAPTGKGGGPTVITKPSNPLVPKPKPPPGGVNVNRAPFYPGTGRGHLGLGNQLPPSQTYNGGKKYA